MCFASFNNYERNKRCIGRHNTSTTVAIDAAECNVNCRSKWSYWRLQGLDAAEGSEQESGKPTITLKTAKFTIAVKRAIADVWKQSDGLNAGHNNSITAIAVPIAT